MLDSTVLMMQVAALGLCLWLESVVPLCLREPGRRLQHGIQNVVIGLVNGVVLTALFSANMHRVRHSDIPAETNSNYASIFSIWDRLGRTYRQRDVRTIHYGLKEFLQPQWQTLVGLLRTPLA